jgi:hypothetical protein
MQPTNTPVIKPKPAQRQHGTRAGRRAWGFDRRTNESKRLFAIMQDLARESGIPLDMTDAVLRRAAELSLASEVARRDLLRRAPGIDVDLLLRLEGCAARAQRDLHSRARAKEAHGPVTPTLTDIMLEIAAEEVSS